ncbi:MAG: putative Ig domain-containing protein [Verrucomicrobiia bacterium]
MRSILFCLCAVLLLAVDMGRAETVLWSDNFDDSGASSRWTASAPGVWRIISPTAGPGSAHSSPNCATTQNYAYGDVRLICTNYNGASSLVVPSADQFPRLRFWHWFNFGYALGFVEISTDAGATWQQLSPTYTYADTATSGGVWSSPSIDLSAFAGQSVQIAFRFAGLCCGNALGWYVDDVAVVTGQPVFNNPEGFESDVDDWAVDQGTWQIGQPTSGPKAAHSGINCAATILAGNYKTNVDTRLISPPFLVPSGSPALSFYHWYNFNSALGFVEISTDGSTWNQISSTYQNGNTGNVWKNVSLNLSAYAGQTVQVAFRFASFGTGTAAGWYVDDISLAAAPVLTVPPTQTIYAGQTPSFTISAALFPTNDTPIFGLVSAKNVVLDPNTGVLTWTNTAPLAPSTNTITVKVTDTNVQLSATASFIIQVLPPLVVTVPPTQTNYVGQELDVTISATNNASPDDYFTFVTNSPTPTNVLIDLNTGELTWTPTAAQKGSNTITITVANNIAPFLRATNRFVVVVSNPPPPMLIVPPTQKIYAGQTLTVTNIATSIFPNSTFTFTQLSGPTNNVVLNATNGVLIWIWATTTNQPVGSTNVFITVSNSISGLNATNHFTVVVSMNPPPPMLIVPSTQTIYAGQMLIVTNYAYYTNSAFPSSAFTFATNPPTPAGVILVTTNDVGVLTWATPIAQPAGTYTNAIMVTDSLTGDSATSNFLVQVLPPHPPTLIVPPTQLIYAGQTMDVTISATNSAYTNCSFTYVVFATNGPPYVDESDLPTDGVLKWTPTAAQAPNIYTIVVGVTESNSLSAISNFLVLVAMPPSPTLIVPPTRTIYAGQTLVVTISATNSILPHSTYTFGIVSASANVFINPTSGVLTWTNTASSAPSTNTITVNVTDNSTLLGATNSFIVRLLLLPTLKIAASTQPAKGSFQLTFSTDPNTTWRIDASTNLLSWWPLLTDTADSSGTLHFTDSPASYPRRFYRAVMQ